MSQPLNLRLLAATQAVYQAYLALQWARQKNWSEDPASALAAHVAVSVAEGNETIPTLFYNSVTLAFDQQLAANKDYTVYALSCKGPLSAEVELKEPAHYTEQDILSLLNRQKITFTVDKHKKVFVGASIQFSGHSFCVGGLHKIALYPDHLAALYNITQTVSRGDSRSMMVVKATGSGKTFIQALWFLSLYLARVNSVFSMPDDSMLQFTKALGRLLPEKIVEAFVAVKPEKNIEGVLTAMKKPSSESAIHLLCSHDTLLNRHFKPLSNAAVENTVFIIDEQHKVMTVERDKRAFMRLSQRFFTLSLTATPKKNTVEHSVIVASMSLREKKEKGQGGVPIILQAEAKTIAHKYKALHSSTVQTKSNTFLLSLAGMFQKEESSTAFAAMEHLPFHYHMRTADDPFYYPADSTDPYEKFRAIRWNLQRPLASNVLLGLDEVDELINLSRILNDPKALSQGVYHQGTYTSRALLYEYLFGLGKSLDESILQAYRQEQKQNYQEAVCAAIKKTMKHSVQATSEGEALRFNLQGADPSYQFEMASASEQLGYKVFHALIDWFLQDVTELGAHELDLQRFKDVSALLAVVKKEFKKNYHQSGNPGVLKSNLQALIREKFQAQGLRNSLADNIAFLIVQLAQVFNQHLIDPTPDNQVIANYAERFVDNSCFDVRLRTHILSKLTDRTALEKFVEAYKTIFLVRGKSQANIPIEEDKPFKKFKETTGSLYDNTGCLRPEAKTFKRTLFQLLDNTAQLHTFSPEYTEDSREEIETLFKLGFIGLMAGNCHFGNFNCETLETVISCIPEQTSETNKPETSVQLFGRARGLNPTKQPTCIQWCAAKLAPAFELNNLERFKNYFPAFFRAEQRFHQIYLNTCSAKLAHEIHHWLKAHIENESIEQSLEVKVQTLVMENLRQLNNQADHDLDKARRQWQQVLKQLEYELDKQLADIENPYPRSSTMRFLGHIMHGFSNFWRWKHYRHHHKAIQKVLQGKAATQDNEILYCKIIKHTELETLSEAQFILNECQQFLQQRVKAYSKQAKSWSVPESEIISSLAPALFHPQLNSALQAYLGYLDQSDIECLLTHLGATQPKISAAQVVLLLDLIKTHQGKTTYQANPRYVSLFNVSQASEVSTENVTENALEVIPLFAAFLRIAELTQEVSLCQCWMYQIGRLGLPENVPQSKLVQSLDNRIKEQHYPLASMHPSAGTLWLAIATKIKTLYPVLRAMQSAGEVNATSHRAVHTALLRVKKIIQPLAVTCNATHFQWHCYTLGKVFSRSPNTISSEYEAHARQLGRAVNALMPLNNNDLNDTQCPKDCLDPLLQSMQKGTTSHSPPTWVYQKRVIALGALIGVLLGAVLSTVLALVFLAFVGPVGGFYLGFPVLLWYGLPAGSLISSAVGALVATYQSVTEAGQKAWTPATVVVLSVLTGGLFATVVAMAAVCAWLHYVGTSIAGTFLTVSLLAWLFVPAALALGTLLGSLYGVVVSEHETPGRSSLSTAAIVCLYALTGFFIAALLASLTVTCTVLLKGPILGGGLFGLPLLAWYAVPSCAALGAFWGSLKGREVVRSHPDVAPLTRQQVIALGTDFSASLGAALATVATVLLVLFYGPIGGGLVLGFPVLATYLIPLVALLTSQLGAFISSRATQAKGRAAEASLEPEDEQGSTEKEVLTTLGRDYIHASIVKRVNSFELSLLQRCASIKSSAGHALINGSAMSVSPEDAECNEWRAKP